MCVCASGCVRWGVYGANTEVDLYGMKGLDLAESVMCACVCLLAVVSSGVVIAVSPCVRFWLLSGMLVRELGGE